MDHRREGPALRASAHQEAVNASLAFSLAILVLFSFAFDPGNSEVNILAVSGGLLWLVFSFAGALSLNRSFARELQNDCLDALIASPAPTGALFVGKALANYALLMAVEIVSLGIFSVFYDVEVMMYFWRSADHAADPWAITIIGTLFSALTVNLRMREVMLPILTYPLLIPPLMSAITLTTDLLAGVPLGQDTLWVKVLLAFDIAFSGLAVVLIDIVLVG